MTRVDFYLGGDGTSRETLACRLAETAYRRGHNVFLWVPEAEIAAWDDRLWAFSDTSFVPHARAGGNEPVVIGADLMQSGDVLIPLMPAPPSLPLDFSRILEIVGSAATEKEQSRVRFRHYRDMGLQPTVHTLS